MKTKAAKTIREWEERAQVPERVPVILFDRSLWSKFVGLCKRKKAGRAAGLAFAALTLWALPARSTSSVEAADVMEMRAAVRQSVLEMNEQGRLPLNGIAGGMVNNIWQTVSHPSDPSRMGCGWQAEYVRAKLAGIPGWRFEERYEVGFRSPILLPHQWLTGYGPNGRVIQIDPWDGITELSKGGNS
jgi:hypothetical protein